MCNIADTAFLGTFQGKQWQKDYLTGKANVSDTKKMMDCMDYIQKWKDWVCLLPIKRIHRVMTRL